MDIDFLRLWDLQGLPPDLAEILEGLTPSVRDFLTAPRTNQQNVAEFAKKEACWEQLCDPRYQLMETLARLPLMRHWNEKKTRMQRKIRK